MDTLAQVDSLHVEFSCPGSRPRSMINGGWCVRELNEFDLERWAIHRQEESGGDAQCLNPAA